MLMDVPSPWSFLVEEEEYEWGAAIAQWIRLCLPSCHPGFESQATPSTLLYFIVKFVLYIVV